MGGGGKRDTPQQAQYTAPVAPDPGPSADELAEKERQRQETNAKQIEQERQRSIMGAKSTLGDDDDDLKTKPTLLGSIPR